MRYGEHKSVLRDARRRTTAAEDAMLDRIAEWALLILGGVRLIG